MVTALIAWVWMGSPYLGLVIGLGMFVNLICAGLFGAAIPLVMKRIGIDPAQSANIILTTVTDTMGFLAFLGFAVLFQDCLVKCPSRNRQIWLRSRRVKYLSPGASQEVPLGYI
jgi:magnesium transporter